MSSVKAKSCASSGFVSFCQLWGFHAVLWEMCIFNLHRMLFGALEHIPSGFDDSSGHVGGGPAVHQPAELLSANRAGKKSSAPIHEHKDAWMRGCVDATIHSATPISPTPPADASSPCLLFNYSNQIQPFAWRTCEWGPVISDISHVSFLFIHQAVMRPFWGGGVRPVRGAMLAHMCTFTRCSWGLPTAAPTKSVMPHVPLPHHDGVAFSGVVWTTSSRTRGAALPDGEEVGPVHPYK